MNTTTASLSEKGHSLAGKRILVCGKGGSGKSTISVLLAAMLLRRNYEVLVIDGDASNPEGLIRLLFGTGVEGEPEPLVEFFGGLDVVTCPVDDPSPLTRVGDSVPLAEKKIDVEEEIPPQFIRQRGRMRFLQVGKISTYGQGCDGPLEKVVRDFIASGDAVSIIDMKAGVEHFGRGIPHSLDIVLGVLDYTLESVSIARRMAEFCHQGGIENYWLILNKIGSDEIESMILDKLGDLHHRVIGSIHFDQDLIKLGLTGASLEAYRSVEEFEHIAEQLEDRVSGIGRRK